MAIYIVIFIFGLIIGSFLNVCIYRIPRKLSIIKPSSRCPSCNMSIRAWDNIPIISYLLLGGKCRYCKTRISLRYPFVEFVNGLFYVCVVWKFGIGWHTLIYLVFISTIIIITFIDLDFQIIPDAITLPGILLGILGGSFLLPDPFLHHSMLGLKKSLLGASTGFILFYLIAFLGSIVFKKEALGGGDIKMMAMVGAVSGWKGVLSTTFLGSLAGTVIGIILMLLKGNPKDTKIPFGPFLAFGAIITIFFGQEIFSYYLLLFRRH